MKEVQYDHYADYPSIRFSKFDECDYPYYFL